MSDAPTEFVGKEELLDRIERGQAEFMEVLAEIPLEDTEIPNELGAWSVKDLIAHFIGHEQRALAELQAARRGEKYDGPWDDNDAFNARAAEEYRNRSFERVVAAWYLSTAKVMEAVKELGDADFEPTSQVSQLLEDSIDGALANNTYEHYAEHLPELEAWVRDRT